MAIKVYDADGNEKDLLWAMEKYNVRILATPRDVDHWEVVELRENVGDAAIIVRLHPPQEGVWVRFGWPEDEVEQKTDAGGQTGFPMGRGAWYRPGEGECGPHFVYMRDAPSDRVECLGMRAPKPVNHDHLDVTFSFVKGMEPEPEPGPDCEDCPIRKAAISAVNTLKAGLGME